jgi:predicted NAD/FAD-binding protein
MLADPSPVEKEILGAIPYRANETVLHTDESVLPRRPLARASWNYHLPEEEPDRATVTYDMTRLQSLPSADTFCVTLNETDRIDPSRVLRSFRYEHPVFAAGRAAAQERHAELIRANRTSYCGAWWGYGFHEDGVRSALDVCRAFGEELP